MDSQKLMDEIIQREGGFVYHAEDLGGPTKYGITQATLSAWLGKPVGVEAVKNLTEKEARWIYNALYITRPGFHKIEYGPLQALMVDCGVHHGVRRAIKWLQHAVKVKEDGIIGPVTLKAVNAAYGPALYRAVLARRLQFFGAILRRNPKQVVFAHGWLNRVSEFVVTMP